MIYYSTLKVVKKRWNWHGDDDTYKWIVTFMYDWYLTNKFCFARPIWTKFLHVITHTHNKFQLIRALNYKDYITKKTPFCETRTKRSFEVNSPPPPHHRLRQIYIQRRDSSIILIGQLYKSTKNIDFVIAGESERLWSYIRYRLKKSVH